MIVFNVCTFCGGRDGIQRSILFCLLATYVLRNVLVFVLASGKAELFFRVSKVHCNNEYSMGS